MYNINPSDMCFQQDGAMRRTATANIDLLKSKFCDKSMLRNGHVSWSPRPCDLTPLDRFLWGYVNSLAYTDKPETIAALKANMVFCYS